MTLERSAANASRATARPHPRPATQMRGEAGTMLGLQQTAGNAAVGRVVSAEQSRAQAAMPGSGVNPSSMALQLGALWNDLVVLPLARADERLTRDKPDHDGALADIDFALRGIGSVKAATPAEDPNRIRMEILEIRVNSLRNLVEEARGKGISRSKLEQQMIDWRVEATELGPELKFWPKKPDRLKEEPVGEVASEPPAAAEATKAEGEAPKAQTTQPGAATTSKAPAGAAPAEEVQSVPQLWRDLVVDFLWKGQQQMDKEGPGDAQWWFLHAANNSGYFAYGTPPGDPTRLRQFRVFHGLAALGKLVAARAGDVTDKMIEECEIAYDHAVTMGKRLTGQPVEEAEPATELATAPAEPEFTWESQENRPFVNDTDLMRP